MNTLLYNLIQLVLLREVFGVSISKLGDSEALISKPLFDSLEEEFVNVEHVRRKRYLGLSKSYKLNKRYQECIGIGDVQGHCKHIDFCPVNVLGSTKNVLNYLCIIEKTHVGVCCPDDIALSGYDGSQLILDLPGGGNDYDSAENVSGCGLPVYGRNVREKSNQSSVQEWPWVAAIFIPDDPSGQQICGGSVITDQYILTAAHCTTGYKPEDLGIRLGEYNFRLPNETRFKDYRVVEIIEHEEFVLASYTNDIAIIRIEKSTSFNTYVWPVCLPSPTLTYEKKDAVVVGWGRQSYDGPLSSVLLEVTVPVWPQHECVEAFLEAVTANNLCAAAYEGGRDACAGDSGGPLNLKLENGRWVIIGIVSWGVGCAQKGNPGVYTRVGNYIPWIVKHTMA